MKGRFYLATCRDHTIELSFTKSYRMPKHWRDRKMLFWDDEGKHPKCQHDNCYKDAEYWLTVDLHDVLPEFIEKGQSRLAALA